LRRVGCLWVWSSVCVYLPSKVKGEQNTIGLTRSEQFQTPTSVLGVCGWGRGNIPPERSPRRRWQGTPLTLSRRSQQRWLSQQTQKNRLNCSLRCVNRSSPIPAQFQSSALHSSGPCLAPATRSSNDGCSTSSILRCVARRSLSMPEHNVSSLSSLVRSVAVA